MVRDGKLICFLVTDVVRGRKGAETQKSIQITYDL